MEKNKKNKKPTIKFKKFVIHTAVYKTLLTEKYKNRKVYEPVNPKLVISQIPGTIKKIFVKKNQKVEKGEILLEVDAMKMYNKILSPEKGVIKSISVKVNDKVSKNVVMVELK